MPAVAGRFLFEQPSEGGPSGVVHGLGQARTGEAAHVQVLQVHRLGFADDPGRLLLCPVHAGVGHLGVCLGDLASGLRPVLAAPGLAGQGALRGLELLLGLPQEAGVVDHGAVGQHGVGGQPEVDPHLGVQGGQVLRFDVHDEAGVVPAGRVQDHRHGRRVGGQCPRPLHPYVTDLGEVQLPVAPDAESVTGEPKGLPVVPLGLEPGQPHLPPGPLAGHGVEEVPVRRVQISQGLDQRIDTDRREPRPLGRALRPGDDQFLEVGAPGIRQAVLTGLLPRCQGVVVHHPRAPERPRQRLSLTRRRVKPIGVPKVHGINLPRATDNGSRPNLRSSLRRFTAPSQGPIPPPAKAGGILGEQR